MRERIPLTLALGSLLALGGLAALTIGAYALNRETRGRHGGGVGDFSERDVGAKAGLRMITGGAVTLVSGSLMLWLHVSV